MPFKPKDRQYRSFSLALEDVQEKKIKTDYYVEGYAFKYSPYVLFEDEEGPVKEEFLRSAFDNTDFSDVIFQYNHEGRVFARTSNESLILWLDDVGLRVAADLGLTTASRELYEDIKAGLSRQMSFSFKVGEMDFDRETRTIIHKSIPKIYDVSAVSIPANSDTEIYARQLADGVITQVKEEFEKRERDRKILRLKLELEDY